MLIKNIYTQSTSKIAFHSWLNSNLNNEDNLIVDWGDLVMYQKIVGQSKEDISIIDRDHVLRVINNQPVSYSYRELEYDDWKDLKNKYPNSPEIPTLVRIINTKILIKDILIYYDPKYDFNYFHDKILNRKYTREFLQETINKLVNAGQIESFYKKDKANDSAALQLANFHKNGESKQTHKKVKLKQKSNEDLSIDLNLIKKPLIITEGKTDWKYLLGALKYFHSNNKFKHIVEDDFYKFGTKDDLNNSNCGTNVQADLSEAQLNKYLIEEISLRTGDVERRKFIIIGIFDSDTDIKIKNKPEYGVYSFKIKPDGISTEFLFSDTEIKSDISGKRLYLGNEFDTRTNRHKSDPNLNLGVGSQKKSGKRVIIDYDVFDFNNQTF